MILRENYFNVRVQLTEFYETNFATIKSIDVRVWLWAITGPLKEY